MFQKLIYRLKRSDFQVYHDQIIYIEPVLFQITNGQRGSTYDIRKIVKDDFKRIAKRLMDERLSVDAYCDVYYAETNELIGKFKKFRLGYRWFSNFLLLYSTDQYSKKSLKYRGDIITLKKKDYDPFFLFMEPGKFESSLKFESLSRNVFNEYLKGEHFSEIENLIESDDNFIREGYYACRLEQLPKHMGKCRPRAEINVRRDEESVNLDIIDRIEQIDIKIADGMELTGINYSQWENTIRPEIEMLAGRKLNEENRKDIYEILDIVSENLVEKENKACIDTEITLSALRSFLAMNGCSVDQVKTE